MQSNIAFTTYVKHKMLIFKVYRALLPFYKTMKSIVLMSTLGEEAHLLYIMLGCVYPRWCATRGQEQRPAIASNYSQVLPIESLCTCKVCQCYVCVYVCILVQKEFSTSWLIS